MKGPVITYEGVTFDNVRAAICAVFFYRKDMPVSEWREALTYVVPMQHNFEVPIEPGSQDTWIQFMVDEDDRLTQDYAADNKNETMKVARISIRFLGKRAEMWAKAFHHLTKRKSVAMFFNEYCNATMLEYVGPIIPMNVDYFGVGNTTLAFDLTFSLQYLEYIEFDQEPLEFISIPEGVIAGQVDVQGEESA